MNKIRNHNKKKHKTIWLICHYAQQPPYNTMLRYHNWGRQLVKRGYHVVIIAASTVHNTDIDVVEQTGSTETVCDNLRYFYVQTPKYSGNGIQRIRNMMHFCFGLKQYVRKSPRPDVIVTSGAYTFPFVRRLFQNIPVITDTLDLWPASMIQYADFSAQNPMVQMLYALEKKAYLESDALIFSMEGGKKYLKERKYASRIDFSKVFHINMGCDIQECDKNREKIQETLPWDKNKFNLVYCGSVRQANQVKQICDAAKELEQRKIEDVFIHIYGNGPDQKALEEYVVENKIKNIRFYGRIEKEKIPFLLSNSQGNLLTYKQVDLMRYGGSQSKLFDYLASGKPIICNAHFGYNLITRYHCGLVTKSQSAKDFADAVCKLRALPKEELEAMGRNSRKTAEAYDQPVLVDHLCEVIQYVMKRKKK
ncbi:MAG: glycosyltransferase family 4 protein [Lachnospiraceae bacterium]|nr:glycosyltransferase family 4 protein [Lachnospiraceae bacterium]